MFEVKELGIEIQFRKGEAVHPRLQEKRLAIFCSIEEVNSQSGVTASALLNPVDRNDKVVGKKVALRKALNAIGYNKDQRKIVWDAFQYWIDSWKKAKVA